MRTEGDEETRDKQSAKATIDRLAPVAPTSVFSDRAPEGSPRGRRRLERRRGRASRAGSARTAGRTLFQSPGAPWRPAHTQTITGEHISWSGSATQACFAPHRPLSRRVPEHLDDAVELVNVVLTGEERHCAQKLGEDRTDAPHVDCRIVRAAAEEKLRRAVPPGRHLVRVRLRRPDIHCRESKVAELEHAASVHKEVPRLDILVHHSSIIHQATGV